MPEIVLDNELPVALSNLGLTDLRPEELAALRRLADFQELTSQNLLVLSRNRRHQVGRVRIRDLVVTIPPPMSAQSFVDLVLYAYGLDIRRFAKRMTAPVELDASRGRDAFLVLLAYLLVCATGELLTSRIARAYAQREERRPLITGRLRWSTDFGRHPTEGVTCQYRILETDNSMNRLVLAGLIKAADILRDTEWISQSMSQVFIWRSVASEIRPQGHEFDEALRRIDRLTEHYRLVLTLSRAVVLGLAPDDPYRRGAGIFQSLEFSLADLWERFLFRFLGAVAGDFGMVVKYNESDPRALTDAKGATYRSIKPDFVLYREDAPVGVIDAKYKPNYVGGSSDGATGQVTKVSNADIYQMFFYQARLMNSYRSARPFPSLLVAPVLGASNFIPDALKRTIVWRSNDTQEPSFVLRVAPMILPDVLQGLREGITERELLTGTEEINEFLVGSSSVIDESHNAAAYSPG